MHELVITGGRVALDDGWAECDVGIDVERVDVSSFIGEEETVTIEIVFVEKRTRERRSLQLQV